MKTSIKSSDKKTEDRKLRILILMDFSKHWEAAKKHLHEERRRRSSKVIMDVKATFFITMSPERRGEG
jgi:hypothetical protein